jgi:hypothetical protein
MKSKIVTLISILISAGIVLASLALIGSLFLQNTLFSSTFYKSVTNSAIYIPLLKQSITKDMNSQSSYVGIPVETLVAGLDDNALKVSLNNHIELTMIYLLRKGEFIKSKYPSDLFKKQLDIFINKIAQSAGQGGNAPTAEQLTLLQEVAKDSAVITENYVNVLNMDLVKDVPEFQRIHRLALVLRSLTWPAAAAVTVLLGVLAVMHRKKMRRAVLFAFTAFWIVGASLMVPAVTVSFFGIAKRLSIQTPYLKYAVDTWLTSANHFVLYTGVTIFAISTVVLVVRILAIRTKRI